MPPSPGYNKVGGLPPLHRRFTPLFLQRRNGIVTSLPILLTPETAMNQPLETAPQDGSPVWAELDGINGVFREWIYWDGANWCPAGSNTPWPEKLICGWTYLGLTNSSGGPGFKFNP